MALPAPSAPASRCWIYSAERNPDIPPEVFLQASNRELQVAHDEEMLLVDDALVRRQDAALLPHSLGDQESERRGVRGKMRANRGHVPGYPVVHRMRRSGYCLVFLRFLWEVP